MSGKGSKQRPSQVSKDSFSINWDTVFGKKKTVPQCEGECKECINNPDSKQLIHIEEPSTEWD